MSFQNSRFWNMVRIYLNDYLVIQDTHSFCDEVVMRSKSSIAASGVHTVSNRHFLSKNSTLISREKILWKCCGFELISCSQLWFHEKKFWVKNSWKCWCFVKIEFLDKNLTFRIVCSGGEVVNPKIRIYCYRRNCRKVRDTIWPLLPSVLSK